MTYATKQDLVDRFGSEELVQLTDRTNMPASVIDDTTVEKALADADAMADGYLAKVYALPIAAVPPVLTKICGDLARYYLHGEAAQKDSKVATDYRDAMRWLTQVAQGLVTLDVGGQPVAQAGSGAIKANPSTRIMRRDTLAGL